METTVCEICGCPALPAQGLHGATNNHWDCEEQRRAAAERVLAEVPEQLRQLEALVASLERSYK